MKSMISALFSITVGLGLTLGASHASAACAGGQWFVTSNTDPTRSFTNDTVADSTITQDLSANCTGFLAWKQPGSPGTTLIENWSSFGYSSAGNFSWNGAPGTTYNGVERINGTLSVSFTHNGSQFFAAQRTVAPRRIKILNQDTHALSNVAIGLEVTIGSNPHIDFEGVGNFSQRYSLGAIMLAGSNNGASFDGTTWTGDFLYTESTTGSQPQKQAVIGKLDSRAFTNGRVHIFFTLNGQQFYDYENIGNWNDGSPSERTLTLNTAGVSQSFDGTYQRGDFLR